MGVFVKQYFPGASGLQPRGVEVHSWATAAATAGVKFYYLINGWPRYKMKPVATLLGFHGYPFEKLYAKG